jgi:FHS family L-fucose permease-like MFS transporter
LNQNNRAAVPVFAAFLAMGFGDAVGPFVSLAKQQFQLSTFVAQLIPFVGFAMFGLLSIPLGIYQDRRGKKHTLLIGLGIMLAGILIPSLNRLSTFPVFLVTIVMLGAGAATLQVAGNPLMRDVSPAGKYARNLSLGQFVKALGSLSGPLIPVIAARFFGADWQIIFPIYGIAVAIALVSAIPLEVQEVYATHGKRATFRSALALLRERYVFSMVFGLFLYVGAEVSLSSGIPLYLKERFAVDINRVGLLGTGLFFLALTVGRFSGGLILNWMRPQTFFMATSIVSIVGLAGIFVPIQWVAVAGFTLTGLGFANIFPLIFSSVLDHEPGRTNELSGLMVTAIVGGAVLPLLMGFVADRLGSVQASFSVPLAALLYIVWTSLAVRRDAGATAVASET